MLLGEGVGFDVLRRQWVSIAAAFELSTLAPIITKCGLCASIRLVMLPR